MKFHFTHLFIWLKTGKLRKISFEPNKVNIITGGSNTGKTAILDIIDYCFFASGHNISDKAINESSAWYGLRFEINGKTYTIARKAPFKDEVSSEYFFSSTGDVPSEVPTANIVGNSLKKLLNEDFGIDQDAKISYGANTLRAGSKVSLRYFLMFNTISQGIINDRDEFFDKQSETRYRDALPRTFDLAVGIDTVENSLKREERRDLEKRLKTLLKQSERISVERGVFYDQLLEISKTSKELGLLDQESDDGDLRKSLQEMVDKQALEASNEIATDFGETKAAMGRISFQIRNLRRFQTEYAQYKKSLASTSDSLKPIEFLSENYTDLVRTSIFHKLIVALEEDQRRIKLAISTKNPLESNISDLIKDLIKDKARLKEELNSQPEEIRTFETERRKYMFLGETKAKLDLYSEGPSAKPEDKSSQISILEGKIADLTVPSTQERREFFDTVMNETTQNYMEFAKEALTGYENYRTFFNYSKKRLHLRKPQTRFIENVGSSSNHMFLHLFMFLGLHEIIAADAVPHVPPFLIIDQFSRPYYPDSNESGPQDDLPEGELKRSDIWKVKLALSLLDKFVANMIEDGHGFQMIVFEHIPPDYWSDMEHVHLVEEFRDGNALIPIDML